MIDIINSVIFHPYVLAMYGVLIFQLEQYFISKKSYKEFLQSAKGNIYRSLVWVGLVVVFDDELLSQYNNWAAKDYKQMPLYMYTVAGLFIDFIRTKITKKVL
jgi:Na+/H+-translocating membrane pyrophosphatase